MAQQYYFRNLRYWSVQANRGAAIGKGKYGNVRWSYRLDCSGGGEEMEREQMSEFEQFENMSKDEPGDNRY